MNSILLSFDIEEFDLPTEFGAEISRDEMFAIAGEGTRRILRTVNEADAHTTFFVTAAFALEFPDLVREMNAEIQARAYVFLGAKVQGVWHTGIDVPLGTKRFDAQSLPPFVC